MNRNIEIKAVGRNPGELSARARQLSGGEPEVLYQEDTFFAVPHGRLKLRQFSPESGQLIWYERPDRSGPKRCSYTLSPTGSPGSLREALAGALGVLGVVRKTRRLYLVGQTRVHLDEVEGLGHFVELEVVMQPEQSDAQGEEIARQLMAELGIEADDLVETAYLDLLLTGGGR